MTDEQFQRLCRELQRLEVQGLLLPALRQVFVALAFSCEAAADPRAESEELLRTFLSDFAADAAIELEGCKCQASRKHMVVNGVCTGCKRPIERVTPRCAECGTFHEGPGLSAGNAWCPGRRQ
jgi:hypothetical protein